MVGPGKSPLSPGPAVVLEDRCVPGSSAVTENRPGLPELTVELGPEGRQRALWTEGETHPQPPLSLGRRVPGAGVSASASTLSLMTSQQPYEVGPIDLFYK